MENEEFSIKELSTLHLLNYSFSIFNFPLNKSLKESYFKPKASFTRST